MSEPPESGYAGDFPIDVQVGDAELRVVVHLASVGGQMTCVGFDVRSFTSPEGCRPPINPDLVKPTGGTWTQITTPVLRSVRAAEAVDEAVKQFRVNMHSFLADYFKADETGASDLYENLFNHGEAPKRGPKARLTDEMLRTIVAPAYLSSARRPVQAVKQALTDSAVTRHLFEDKSEESGYYVSPDVARKAVQAARQRGFIPPAKKGGGA